MTQAINQGQAAQRRKLYDSVPAVVTIYGPRGYGKTTDLLYSFPRGLFIARKGALKPSVGVVGYIPMAVEEANDMDAVKKVMQKHLSKGGGSQFDAVVIDEWDMVVDAQVTKFKPRFNDGRQLYGKVGDLGIEIVNLARDFKCHAAFNCGVKDPGVSNSGHPYFGGPKLPGQLMEKFTGRCDMVLRADTAPIRKPWPVCYRVGPRPPNTGWVAKDRHNVTPDDSPMNLGELLRVAGYAVGRPPGFEWMETIVTEYAGYLGQGHAAHAVLLDLVKKATANGVPEWALAWVLRDTRDRAEIAKWSTNRIGREFGIRI